MSSRLAIIIILLSMTNQLSFLKSNAENNILMKTLTESNSSDETSNAFKKIIVDHLKEKPTHENDSKNLLMQIKNFIWDSPLIWDLKDVDTDTMKVAFTAIMESHKADLLQNKYQSFMTEVLKLCRKSMFRIIQKNRSLVETFNEIKSRFGDFILDFKNTKDLKPLVTQNLINQLMKEVNEFAAKTIPIYNDIVDFQRDPFNMLENLMMIIFEENNQMANAISTNMKLVFKYLNDLILLTASFGPNLGAFSIDEWHAYIVEKYVIPFLKNRKISKETVDYYYITLTTDMSQSKSKAVITKMRELILGYFYPDSLKMPTLSKEYCKMVIRNWRMNNKFEHDYKQLNTKMEPIFILDLTLISLQLKSPIREVEEAIQNLAFEFKDYMKILEHKDIQVFDYYREMIMSYSRLFDDYEDLFANSYYLGLLWVQYHSQYIVSYDYYICHNQFDEYIDGIFDWRPKLLKGIMSVIPFGSYGQPLRNIGANAVQNESGFILNLEENYLAYKFINLAYVLNQQRKIIQYRGVSFAEYTDFKDKNIEQFLFENEEFLRLILNIHAKYAWKKGLNSKMFNGLAIQTDFLYEQNTKNPLDYFRAETIQTLI